jgi:lipopolysaccharide heptosyltransferase I
MTRAIETGALKLALDRVLIVRLSALGDIVHALPVLAALKRDWPNAKVDWLVEEAYAPILALAEGLNRRIIVRAKKSVSEPNAVAFGGALGFPKAVGYLRRQRYDAALDLQGLIKSAVWARLSGAKRVIGFHRTNLREKQAAMFYSEMIHPVTTQHVITKNLMVLDNLGSVAGPPVMPIRTKPASSVDAAIRTAGGAKRYIVINPGAAWPNKRWPPERFGELASALKQTTGLSSLVTWGPKERDLADSVVAASRGAAQAAPATEIADLATLMRDAALVVSGDTGPLHIAAAMGTPLVGLYGPTWPQRNGPWDVKDEVLSRAQTCQCHHKRKCQIGDPCIFQIQVADVAAAAERRLARR